MTDLKRPSFVVTGLTLFSMFFGSGNLIFPLSLGMAAGPMNWFMAFLGFTLTGVCIPALGVVAMIKFQGDTFRFFDILGKKFSLIFLFFFFTFWIPMGAGARCITLAYSSLGIYANIPQIYFVIPYCIAVYWLMNQDGKIIDIMGQYLTPLLILFLAMIIYKGLYAHYMGIDISHDLPHDLHDKLLIGTNGLKIDDKDGNFFWHGCVMGYQTMDLMSAFFFSASLITMINQYFLVPGRKGGSKENLVYLTKSFSLGLAILALIYGLLIFLAAIYHDLLAHHNVPHDQLLSFLGKVLLGDALGLAATGAIILACFTTLIAMAQTYADYFIHILPKGNKFVVGSRVYALLAISAVSFIGLAGITKVTAPGLNFLYPFLILLALIRFFI